VVREEEEGGGAKDEYNRKRKSESCVFHVDRQRGGKGRVFDS